MITKAIIGGTGVYDLGEKTEEKNITTNYGEAKVYIKEIAGQKIAFLPRHGAQHSVPPHRINFRANISALHKLGVKEILATAAVGSMNMDFPPGSLVLLDQFIDFTKARPLTFYEGEEGVIHTDMRKPYCGRLQKILLQKAATKKLELKQKGVYVCVEGPRFETEAEIKFYRHIGGDLVGMTNVPEVVLARELQMCYAAVGIVVNWCNGVVPEDISHDEIITIMKEAKEKISSLFIKVFTEHNENGAFECNCQNCLIEL
ncbi:MAG: 5-methylthioadenosine phosphorylase [Clostridia bacterium]|nr:5-methylthioadenosine phosphorylase [Clostridia bacterium]